MESIRISIIICLITGSLVNSSEHAQLRFLDQLIDVMRNDRPIETILMFRQSEDKNCALQRWIPKGIPFLHSNKMGKMRLRENFNNQAVAIVCFRKDSDFKLLELVAGAFETIRQERIILWTQGTPSKKNREEVSRQADKFKFSRMLLLEMGDDPKGVVASYRLNAFPTPRFARLTNISKIKDMTLNVRNCNFRGRELIVKLNSDTNFRYGNNNNPSVLYPAAYVEDMEIFQFAERCNARLKVHDGIHEDQFDIKLSPQILTMENLYNNMDFVNPWPSSSLLIVVPCNSQLKFVEVVKHLEVLTWVWYLLSVYGSFVLVESFILVVTHRITGVPHRLNPWNPLLNLRAFCAIFGLSFPEFRRAGLSLRQLFLAMAVFGFFISNFFSCKLCALLTKPIEHAQVRNFDELRASGMTTVTDTYLRSYIEREIDPEFFRVVVPKVITAEYTELVKQFLSFDKGYSYLLLSTNWQRYDNFQLSSGNKIYCDSQDLVITAGLPWVYAAQNNSFYKWPLAHFLMTIQETGFSKHWVKGIHDSFMKANNLKPQKNMSNVVPISYEYLCWLWHLLLAGYGIATVAFLFEIALCNRRKGMRKSKTISDTSV